MFKYVFIIGSLLMISLGSVAQENTTEEQPVYLRFPTIPQFKVNKAPDSTSFTRENLKKNVNTVFFIFSPDCNHCQHETESMVKKIKEFNKITCAKKIGGREIDFYV
jgi:cytochrome oxidase Cu insertion factor (SCO1/SenC/PrrC family)